MAALKGISLAAMLVVCGFASAAGPALVGQAQAGVQADGETGVETMLERILTKAITALGPLGILGWYLYHRETKGRPDDEKARKEEREAFCTRLTNQAAEHKEALDSVLSELRAEREQTLLVIRACESRRQGG